ncbi:MAG: DUF4097 domain-containing protein [Gammaproteobacteria bacterium]|nr:DUF4097 domain-containing protein [Gammaproteobacteria bacterium]MDH3416187.1 DUF4097 domain-containing protein [Gammaproteobacteria bacterium]
MNSTPSIKILALCGILLSGFWAGNAIGATGTFHQVLSVDGPLLLDVSTGSGSIEISSGSAQSVEVTGHIRVGNGSFFGLFGRSSGKQQELVDQLENEPPISLVDGHLKVGHLKKPAFKGNVSISYEIVVPAGTEVISHTGSGAQTISEVAGPVEAQTGSGRITLTDIGGAVNARTGSGAIQADQIAGAFEAHTGSGSVRLTQVAPGDVVVTLGSGSSTLHGVVGSLHVEGGSGRIDIDGQQQGDWNIDTGSGSVRIKLPEDAAFNLDAHSGSGGITVDHPLTVQGKMSKRHMRGEVRGGGDRLTVETGSGGIRIE